MKKIIISVLPAVVSLVIIFLYPPINIFLIFFVVFGFSLTAGSFLGFFMNGKTALLIAVFLFIFLLLKTTQMLEAINIVLAAAFLGGLYILFK